MTEEMVKEIIRKEIGALSKLNDENFDAIKDLFLKQQKKMSSVLNSLIVTNEKIDELEERSLRLEEISIVQNKHIAFLQRRTRSFFDRFKIGRFKPLDITKESEVIKPKRKRFVLNDD